VIRHGTIKIPKDVGKNVMEKLNKGNKNMNKNVAEYLKDFNPEIRLHEEYSGRGMFGQSTYAVSGDWGEIMDTFAGSIEEIYNDNDDEMLKWILESLSRLRFDNLGLRYIFY
jgi:hemerythrin-like domain-containing protein